MRVNEAQGSQLGHTEATLPARDTETCTPNAVPLSESERPDGRDVSGRFTAGNAIGHRFQLGNEHALVHGGRRLELGRETGLIAQRRFEVRDALLVDAGGADEVSTAKRAVVETLSEAIVLRETLWAHLEAVGPLTKAGRRRAAVDLWLAASGRVERLAAAVGLERRAKAVQSATDIIAEYGARRQPQEPRP